MAAVAAAPRTGAPDGSGAGSRARALLQAWRAAGHEPRLRAPHPTEPARPVPPRPAPRLPAPAWPGPAVPDSRSAPRRDEYDKKVKQAAKEKARRRHTPAPTRPRKPDLQVYLPRHRGEAARPARCSAPGPSASTRSSFLSGKKLFYLSRLISSPTSISTLPNRRSVILPAAQGGLKARS